MSVELDQKQRREMLQARVRHSRAITAELLARVATEVCTRFSAHGNAAKERLNQLVACGAWTDAVLLLLQLELPLWKLRRILYEEGGWHCFLSQQPWFPLEFDEGAEATHELLPLAILLAFIEARSAVGSAAASAPQANATPSCTVCCENLL